MLMVNYEDISSPPTIFTLFIGTHKCCYGFGDLNVYFMPEESRHAWAELASLSSI